MKLVNPANKRKYTRDRGGHRPRRRRGGRDSMGELGYNVLKVFCYQDSARRAHSIAAQGGINAAKNYQNDGDSVYRLFYDTVKGGDFRAREANVYRLAEVSVNIIDQCVAQGVPFAREYGGLPGQPLLRRRAGLADLLRPGQTGQQLLPRRLPGARAAGRSRQGDKMFTPAREMLDLVVKVDGKARGIVCPRPGHRRAGAHAADAVVLWPPAATATCSTCPPTPWAAT